MPVLAEPPPAAAPPPRPRRPRRPPPRRRPRLRPPPRRRLAPPAKAAPAGTAPSAAPPPGDAELSRLRGAAARTALNMAASLSVPTATSVRAVPAKLLIDNRIVINNHLQRGRGGKISFTHLIGYALVQAVKALPEMNAAYAEEDGKPVLAIPHHVNLGLAIDLKAKDGSRQLLVPNIKGAEEMDFRQFWSAYEDVVRKARSGKLTVADFQGTTISLTNPGTIGTEHSVPRLMPGQGAIIGVGAMEYPAAYQGASEETMARLAISKTVTLTSTYDHRIIQGAQSGDFLRIVHQMLLGENRFYDGVFESLRIPYEPVRWVKDFPYGHEDDVTRSARVQELIHAYRVRGHLMADTNPIETVQRKHADLDIIQHGLTLWDLEREFATGGFGGRPIMRLRDILGVLRDSYCRTIGIEYMHIQDPEERKWIQAHIEVPPDQGGPRRAGADPVQAQRGRGVRDVPADQVRRPEALLARGRRGADPAARRGAQRGRRGRARRGRGRHGAPRQAQRARQRHRQVLRADLQGVRGQPRPEVHPGLRRREVPPGRRRHLHRRERQDRSRPAWSPTRATWSASTR